MCGAEELQIVKSNTGSDLLLSFLQCWMHIKEMLLLLEGKGRTLTIRSNLHASLFSPFTSCYCLSEDNIEGPSLPPTPESP